MEYAIIDIETSGGKPKESKIIEIAIIIHNGEKIIDSFDTLINPEKKIDWYVTKLTGISNKDVESAPKFYEIAKKIYQLIDKRVFVAHNIGFDYPIVRNEFKNLGFDLRLPHMCTIQASKILIPGLESYGLKNLSQHLNIDLDKHHRAMSDTFATSKIFEHIFQIDKNELKSFIKEDINLKKLHKNFNFESFDDLPSKTGVYYFYDENDTLIYLKKSNHIKKSVEKILKNPQSKKEIELQARVVSLKGIPTGNELISQIIEFEELEKMTPVFNLQNKKQVKYGIYSYLDQNDYENLAIKKIQDGIQPLMTFNSLKMGENILNHWVEQLNINKKYCHINGDLTGDLFTEEIDSPSHNEKINDLKSQLAFYHEDYLILSKGRIHTEYGFVFLSDGKVVGYGFIFKYLIKKNPLLYKKHLQKVSAKNEYLSILHHEIINNDYIEILKVIK